VNRLFPDNGGTLSTGISLGAGRPFPFFEFKSLEVVAVQLPF